MELVSTYLMLISPEKERKMELLNKISKAIDANKISYEDLKEFYEDEMNTSNNKSFTKKYVDGRNVTSMIIDEFVNNINNNIEPAIPENSERIFEHRNPTYFDRNLAAAFVNSHSNSIETNEQSFTRLSGRYRPGLIKRFPIPFGIPQELIEDE